MDKLTRQFGPVVAKIEIRADGTAVLHLTTIIDPEKNIGAIAKGLAAEWSTAFAGGRYRKP